MAGEKQTSPIPKPKPRICCCRTDVSSQTLYWWKFLDPLDAQETNQHLFQKTIKKMHPSTTRGLAPTSISCRQITSTSLHSHRDHGHALLWRNGHANIGDDLGWRLTGPFVTVPLLECPGMYLYRLDSKTEQLQLYKLKLSKIHPTYNIVSIYQWGHISLQSRLKRNTCQAANFLWIRRSGQQQQRRRRRRRQHITKRKRRTRATTTIIVVTFKFKITDPRPHPSRSTTPPLHHWYSRFVHGRSQRSVRTWTRGRKNAGEAHRKSTKLP